METQKKRTIGWVVGGVLTLVAFLANLRTIADWFPNFNNEVVATGNFYPYQTCPKYLKGYQDTIIKNVAMKSRSINVQEQMALEEYDYLYKIVIKNDTKTTLTDVSLNLGFKGFFIVDVTSKSDSGYTQGLVTLPNIKPSDEIKGTFWTRMVFVPDATNKPPKLTYQNGVTDVYFEQLEPKRKWYESPALTFLIPTLVFLMFLAYMTKAYN